MASPLLPSPGPWMGSISQVSRHLYLYTHNSGCSECTDSVYFLTEIDKDSRRTLTASGSLILNDVNFGDTAIYQCQASNKHGTILINTNIYVVGGCLFWSCHLNRVLYVNRCLHDVVFLLFQSCLRRSLLRMVIHTHLQRAKKLCWSVRPSVPLNLKSAGENCDCWLYIVLYFVFSFDAMKISC